jgi:hypothetical protein
VSTGGKNRAGEGRTEATMAVVYHHVATQRPRCIVVDATRSISHIPHDNTLRPAESLNNVDESTSVHRQTLRHLQRDPLSAVLLDLGDGFRNLEIVVGGEEGGDGGLEERIDFLLLLEGGNCDDRRGGGSGGARGRRGGPADEALAGLRGRRLGWCLLLLFRHVCTTQRDIQQVE